LTTSNGANLTVLIFTPHRIAGGGVLNFTEVLGRNFDSSVNADRFIMGQRPTRLGRAFRLVVPIYDAIRLARLLFLKHHDVYHVNPSFVHRSIVRDGFFLLLLRAFGRQNILVYFHGWDDELYRRVATSRVMRSLFRFVYGRAARVLVLASSFAVKLQFLGLPPDRIRVVTTMFEGKALEAATRKRNDDNVWVLFMARLVAAKGLYEVLQAFKLVSEADQKAVLIIAGDGPEAQRARDWCATHALEPRVRFPGYVTGEEKTQLLVDSDIFVLPSSHGEGCPISLLEAMGAGLPVVVTPVGGIPDIVRDGVNGFLLKAPDNKALGDALIQLVREPDLRARMGQCNRDEAWRNYEAKTVAASMERQYQELSDKRHQTTGP
jgi:glycosyltransferase involved in cell wall biosynthesis